MTKLVKTDHAIVPATSFAGKVEEALADDGKLAVLGRSLLDRPRYVYGFDVSNRSEPFADCFILRDDNQILMVKLDAEGRCSWRTPSDTDMLYLPPGQRLIAEVEDRNSQGKPSSWTRFAYTMRVVGERQVYNVSVLPGRSDDTYALVGRTSSTLTPAIIDSVGPGIALTVEPLNPVLRAEGSREIVVDTETDKQALGRMFRPVGSPPVSVLATAIAPRVNRFTEFADMMKVIDRQLFDRFAEPMPERAVKAASNAFELGVPASAETTVNPCGCIWALQTTFTSGSGDIVLDLCATHARSRT